MITKFTKFTNEKLYIDDIIDLYSYLIKILNIHEKHFYNDNKISSNADFKNDINGIFHKMVQGKKTFTEELFNKISEYERNLYNDSKMIPDDNFGCSMWDVCEIIIEDPDTLNINKYIQNFSDNDIYVETESPYNSDTISNLVDGLDDVSWNYEEDDIEEIVNNYFDAAKKYNKNEERIDFVIKSLKNDKRYPKYQIEFDEIIDKLMMILKNNKKR